jgi:hypothetical protein
MSNIIKYKSRVPLYNDKNKDFSLRFYVDNAGELKLMDNKLELKGTLLSSPPLTMIVDTDSNGDVYIGSNLKYYRKFSSTFTLIWTKDLGNNVSINSLIVDDNGDSYIIYSSNNNLRKYNSGGSIVWTKTLPSQVDFFATNISIDKITKDVYVNTLTRRLKYNSSGTLQWSILNDLQGKCIGYNNGYLYFGTISDFISPGVWENSLFRINPSDGSVIWSNNRSTEVSHIHVNDDGSFYAACGQYILGPGAKREFIKYDSDGSIIWTNDFNYQVTSASKIIVDKGFIYIPVASGTDWRIMKLRESDGTLVTERALNYPDDLTYSISLIKK